MRFVTDDLVVDRTSSVQIQVIGAGLPRCATSSLQAALESNYINLDPCMHMAHVSPHADRGTLLLTALREPNAATRHKLLHGIFDGFQATTDFPGCMFADDLMDMYPEAKIVLNKRPGGARRYLWKVDRNLYSVWRTFMQRSMVSFGLTADELFTAKHYDAHNEWVCAEAAKRGREVLEFEPRDGWASLCKFLGKEAPGDDDDEPFPHRNDASEIRMVQIVLYARGGLSWVALAGVVYGIARLAGGGRMF
ncbi:hypothetical protein AOCH_000608 [Aspergillus ochraceoroseus]|uniref:Uncharacterized protein n=1 Tax=Aspergillus ochraceoroseus TaxID=138278 RepID=A0A0F8WNN5_9EURO|nr:hypothetical protein AOCH_000608 [Aspergillus ochraceoroseus]